MYCVVVGCSAFLLVADPCWCFVVRCLCVVVVRCSLLAVVSGCLLLSIVVRRLLLRVASRSCCVLHLLFVCLMVGVCHCLSFVVVVVR